MLESSVRYILRITRIYLLQRIKILRITRRSDNPATVMNNEYYCGPALELGRCEGWIHHKQQMEIMLPTPCKQKEGYL